MLQLDRCTSTPQEIRDLAEKWRQSDAGLPALSAAAPFARRLNPNLTYDYSNRVVRTPRRNLVPSRARWLFAGKYIGTQNARVAVASLC